MLTCDLRSPIYLICVAQAEVQMAPKEPKEPKEPDYYVVKEEANSTLSCNCPRFRQTGKTCEHTFGVKLEIDFGNVERYNGKLPASDFRALSHL
jgi:hypothetical protein